MLESNLSPAEYDLYIQLFILKMLPNQRTPVSEDSVYRIQITPEYAVRMMCFGMPTIDADEDGVYASVDDLPKWVRDRLAVLSLVSCTPPTQEIEGVGRRISESIYWVYK